MKIRLFSALPALLVASWFANPVEAQVLYGSLVGTVVDQSGGVVPGAKVSVFRQDTGLAREATSDSDGRYSILDLPGGTYSLTITADGFRTVNQPEVRVAANTVTRIPVKLDIGQMTEQVTVSAQAVALQADKADVHVELSAPEVQSIPLARYRNYQSLLDLVPGSVPGGYTNSPGSEPARSLVAQVNGTSYVVPLPPLARCRDNPSTGAILNVNISE